MVFAPWLGCFDIPVQNCWHSAVQLPGGRCAFHNGDLFLLPAHAMNHVLMYTTQVCPYCVRAKALLKQRGVAQIEEVRVDLDPTARERMMTSTGRRTVPQIFIGETHVGGCDDLIALDQRGGLMPLLQGG